MTCRFIAVAVACLTVLCVWPKHLGADADQQPQGQTSIPPKPAPPGTPNPAEWQRQYLVSEAYRRHGLHEAAKVNGGEYVTGWDIYGRREHGLARTLNDLIGLGPVIVVGTVQSAVAKLSEDAMEVVTFYDFAVKETLKGRISSDTVQIRIPHGRITFADGTSAEYRTQGFSIEVGRQYIFWIRLVEGTAYHVLSPAITQGVIDISAEHARSLTSDDRPVKAMLEGKEVGALLAELRATIAERESRPTRIGAP